MMLGPEACMTVPFFTSVTVTGVTVVFVVIVAVPFMPGFKSLTESCWPSTVKRKSSGTISSRVPSGSFTTRSLPSTAMTWSDLVGGDVGLDCYASDTVAVSITTIEASSPRVSVRCIKSSPLKMYGGSSRNGSTPANGEYASRPIASEKGADDEALWRGADVIEGIAGHERQRPRAGRIQDGDVRRVDHPRALHAIDLLSVERFELDLVARNDVLEPSEEAVTMAGDARVSLRSGKRRVVDVTDTAIERAVVGAGQHWHLEADFRDSHDGERSGRGRDQGRAPGADPHRRPEGLVGRPGLPGGSLKRSEPFEIVPGLAGRTHVEHSQHHQAGNPEGPARSLGSQKKPAA